MTRNKSEPVKLVSRRHSTSNLVDDPPLGHLQALVLKTLYDLGDDAFGQKALTELSIAAGVQLDTPDVYSSIKRLMRRAYVKLEQIRRQPGGPPVKIYKVTGPGLEALKITADHHRAVTAYLDRMKN